MLSASEFAKFISVSLEAGRAKHQRHEVLGLKGATRGLRFPKWQVTSDGGLLQTCHGTSIFLAAFHCRSP
jgi:hypothetical protein